MDHASVAKTVLSAVGGPDNINAAAHCATRLRLVLADESLVDQEALDACEDLKGTFAAGGMFQIIVGPGDVNVVYKNMIDQGVREVSKDEAKTVATEKQNKFSQFIKLIADIFVPILPALIAGGLMMSLNNVMVAEGLFGPESLISRWPWLTDYAAVIQLVSSAAFAALPVLIGFSATKRFGGNEYLGAAMGAAMISSSLVNAYSAVEVAATSDGIPTWKLFGLAVTQVGYQGQVLPMIAIAFILATIEKFLRKRLRGTADFLVTPLVTMILTGFLAFVIVGPIMREFSQYLTDGLLWLYTNAGPIGGFLFGLVYSPIVVTGLHQSFPAIELPLIAEYTATGTGGSFILPIASMANSAQGAAALAIFLLIKNQRMKSLAGASSASAFFGITEPAMFGVNLRIRWAFFAGMIGSACGSALVALFDLRSISLGSAGILGFVAMVPKDIPLFFVAQAVTIAVAFAGTFFWGKTRGRADVEEGVAEVKTDIQKEELSRDADQAIQNASPAAVGVATAVATEVKAVKAALKAGAVTAVGSPLAGQVVPLGDVPDPGFASGAVGKGIAVDPTEGKVVAPADGKVMMTFPTGHAIGLLLDSGIELLIHVGIDTVNMEGKGFKVHVSRGDRVAAGTPLVSFDRAQIVAAGYSPITPVLVTNYRKFGHVEEVATGRVSFGDKILTVAAKDS